MPNIKSAKKRVKITAVNTLRNKAYKSALRTSIKKAQIAVSDGAENKADAFQAAVVKIDQAVTKGILHKNTAARKKSKLARAFNQAQ